MRKMIFEFGVPADNVPRNLIEGLLANILKVVVGMSIFEVKTSAEMKDGVFHKVKDVDTDITLKEEGGSECIKIKICEKKDCFNSFKNILESNCNKDIGNAFDPDNTFYPPILIILNSGKGNENDKKIIELGILISEMISGSLHLSTTFSSLDE